ncbi:MAG: DUF3592 domain-containing protein [Candidatus Hydrogenedentes bacterium]|nr:DUF3592 domain-containing protein [Candidatus Hydrogenedentota bacterium]
MKSISRKGSGNAAGCLPRIVGLLLVIPGGLVFYFFSFVPMADWSSAQDWAETSCTITGSSVGRHDSSDGGPTYSIDISYRYTWAGQTFTGDRYNFFGGSSSGRSGKDDVVRQFPVGSTQTCFVNPDAPEEAALNRDFSWVYLIGCFGLIFVLGGLYLLVFRKSKKEDKSLSRGGKMEPVPAPAYGSEGSKTFKGGRNSRVGLIFVSIFAVFWNGIILLAFSDQFGGGAFSIVMMLFMIPFVLVGLALIAGVVYFFLALFNPKVLLSLSPGEVPLGGTGSITWSFAGNTRRIQKLSISVTGTEAATYRRGTSTITDKSVFEKIVLVEAVDPQEIAQGEVAFSIPEFTAPAFEASNNKITWHIKVEGDIPKWPDVREEFELAVAPLPTENDGAMPRRAEFREG